MKTRIYARLILLTVIMVVAAGCGGSSNAPGVVSPTAAAAQNPTAETANSPTAAAPTEAPTAVARPTSMPTSEPATAPTAAATSTVNAPTGGADALDLIVNATRAQATAKSFRSTNVTTTSKGTTTIVTEYVAPDRIHMTTTSTAANTSQETIIIKGQGTWQQQNGKWVKSPFDMSTLVFTFLDPKNVEQLKQGISVGSLQFIGPELLDATPTLVYQYTVQMPGVQSGSTLNGTYKAWVGLTDHRIYKLEGDTDSPVNKGEKIHTVITYQYDIDIQIQQPS